MQKLSWHIYFFQRLYYRVPLDIYIYYMRWNSCDFYILFTWNMESARRLHPLLAIVKHSMMTLNLKTVTLTLNKLFKLKILSIFHCSLKRLQIPRLSANWCVCWYLFNYYCPFFISSKRGLLGQWILNS